MLEPALATVGAAFGGAVAPALQVSLLLLLLMRLLLQSSCRAAAVLILLQLRIVRDAIGGGVRPCSVAVAVGRRCMAASIAIGMVVVVVRGRRRRLHPGRRHHSRVVVQS